MLFFDEGNSGFKPPGVMIWTKCNTGQQERADGWGGPFLISPSYSLSPTRTHRSPHYTTTTLSALFLAVFSFCEHLTDRSEWSPIMEPICRWLAYNWPIRAWCGIIWHFLGAPSIVLCRLYTNEIVLNWLFGYRNLPLSLIHSSWGACCADLAVYFNKKEVLVYSCYYCNV